MPDPIKPPQEPLEVVKPQDIPRYKPSEDQKKSLLEEAAKVPPVEMLDWKKAEARINEVATFLSTFEGKSGYNPFIYYEQKVKPLVERYMGSDDDNRPPERTPQLYKQMIELSLEEPSVDKLKIKIPAIIKPLGNIVSPWDGPPETKHQ